MGFTGKRALAFKLAYIEAFNQMEAALTGQTLPPPAPTHIARSDDAAFLINVGTTALGSLDAVLHAIALLHERGGNALHIKHLAEMGRYMAADFSSLLNGGREKRSTRAKAGEMLQ